MKQYIFILLSLMLISCQSLSRPYCKRVKENPLTIEEYKANEEVLLDCIEDLELFIKHK